MSLLFFLKNDIVFCCFKKPVSIQMIQAFFYGINRNNYALKITLLY